MDECSHIVQHNHWKLAILADALLIEDTLAIYMLVLVFVFVKS